ncbi:BTAD domain-containing putative transcriptional regulator [Micromonospora sp. NPDC049523]|uniref:AfsR/SARP family transcriptional regulator n=1 Tax=Micromonospora sp. NPDC049523 TaxID=3155921 RepID=UPI00341992F4
MYIGGPRERRSLTALLLQPNRTVSTERLVDVLWGERPPATAAAQIRNTIATLRRHLAAAQAGPAPVVRSAHGFLVRVEDGQLDAAVFDRHVTSARSLTEAGAFDLAGTALRAALDLWRGPALGGADGPVLGAAAHAWEERRLATYEELADVDLRLGRNGDVVADLGVLVQAYPLRERLRGQLMVALYRNGQPAEALALVHDLRSQLADRYGLEPGPQIRRIEASILRNDPELHAPSPSTTRPVPASSPPVPVEVPAPAELPAAVPDFVGRDDQIARLDSLLPDTPATALTTLALVGPGGVGKTALAVWWLHRISHLFPDGQLFVNLHGYGPGPRVRPVDALARFLRALRVPEERIPIGQDESAALFRSLLAGRRFLILLDNAASAEQVVPLLPGDARCLVMVTSRSRLGALIATQGARRLTLDVLSRHEARSLLGAVLGRARVEAEDAASTELARLCGHLPLALRIAAARLDETPDTPIADYTSALAAAGPLDALAVEDEPEVAVRAVLDASYARLTAAERLLFGLLDLAPGPDVTAEAVAALAAWPLSRAEEVLDRLAAAHLLTAAGNRYAMHDLVRQYCADRATSESTGSGAAGSGSSGSGSAGAERGAALDRMLDWYLHVSDSAAVLLYPQMARLELPPAGEGLPSVGLDGHADAGAWLAAELPNLLAAIERAGPRPVAWLLADTLRGYFWQTRRMVDWQRAAQAGLAAAADAGDPPARAAGWLSLGQMSYCSRRYPEAIEHYTTALEVSRRAGLLRTQAAILGNLASVRAESGQPGPAMDDLGAALAINRTIGWRAGEAVTLGNLGLVAGILGRLRQAEEHYLQALPLHRATESYASLAVILGNLADIEIQFERFGDASEHASEALELARKVGRLDAETLALIHLAEIAGAQDDRASSVRHASEAVRLIGTDNDREIEAMARNSLGRAFQRCGNHREAVDQHAEAYRLATETGSRYVEVESLIGLAAGRHLLGEAAQADADIRRAIAECRTVGYRDLEGQALTVLATLRLAEGDAGSAIGYVQQSLTIHRQTGGRLAESRALALLTAGQPMDRHLDGELGTSIVGRAGLPARQLEWLSGKETEATAVATDKVTIQQSGG